MICADFLAGAMRYNYDSHWTVLSMGLSPIGMTTGSAECARPPTQFRTSAPGDPKVQHYLHRLKSSSFGVRDNYDRSGVWLVQKDATFEVFDVIVGGPADEARTRNGGDVTSTGFGGAQLEIRLVLRDLV